MTGEDKVRLGGMALENGVLVQGPTAWACAVRLPSGGLRVAAELKRFRASGVRSPLLRGPARLFEQFSVLPAIRRRRLLERAPRLGARPSRRAALARDPPPRDRAATPPRNRRAQPRAARG